MNKQEAVKLSERVRAILARELGPDIAVDYIKGMVGASDVTLSFKFTPGGSETKDKVARARWNADCAYFKLLPEHFGRRIKLKTFDTTVTLQAINYRAPKFPIECLGDDGKSYKITTAAALRALSEQS